MPSDTKVLGLRLEMFMLEFARRHQNILLHFQPTNKYRRLTNEVISIVLKITVTTKYAAKLFKNIL